MSEDGKRDEQFEQLMRELKRKREQPDALKFSTLEMEMMSRQRVAEENTGDRGFDDGMESFFGDEARDVGKARSGKTKGRKKSKQSFSKRSVLGTLRGDVQDESNDETGAPQPTAEFGTMSQHAKKSFVQVDLLNTVGESETGEDIRPPAQPEYVWSKPEVAQPMPREQVMPGEDIDRYNTFDGARAAGVAPQPFMQQIPTGPPVQSQQDYSESPVQSQQAYSEPPAPVQEIKPRMNALDEFRARRAKKESLENQISDSAAAPPAFNAPKTPMRLPDVPAPPQTMGFSPEANPISYNAADVPQGSSYSTSRFIRQEFIRIKDTPPEFSQEQTLDPENAATQNFERQNEADVDDGVDERFKSFFGETVIIDRPPSERPKKWRRAKEIVKAGFEDEPEQPVFDDDVDDEQFETEKASLYRSEEDAAEVQAGLMSRAASDIFRTVVTGIFAVVSAALSLSVQFGALPDMVSEPLIFYLVAAAVCVLAVAFNAKNVFGGLGRLISFRADGESLLSFVAVIALAEPVFYAVTAAEIRALYGSIILTAMFFAALGSALSSSRILAGFKAISDPREKYASSILDDYKVTKRITRELETKDAKILLKRKAGITDDYLEHATSKDNSGSKVFVLGSISVFIIILCGVFSYLTGENAIDTAGIVCGTAALCAPFSATMAGAMPIRRMQRRLSKIGAVVPGYSAAQQVCEANCVVLEGRELFPKSSVVLHGIKTFERERIDKAILYTASLLIQSCDTMAHMFMSVIQNNTEMLYEVDSVEYEAGLGYSYWIDKTRMLLGTREYLMARDVAIPSLDYESRYTKTSTRDAIYLAVSGKLYAMFVISYSPDAEAKGVLKRCVKEGINILVHTRDFNLTDERIARLYKIPKTMVAVIRESDVAELTKRTEYVRRAPSILTNIGPLTSFVKGISACYNVNSAVKMAYAVQFIGLLIGMILAVVVTLLGSMLAIGMLSALLFQAIWWVIIFVVVSVQTY